jgi:hypothetical protein
MAATSSWHFASGEEGQDDDELKELGKSASCLWRALTRLFSACDCASAAGFFSAAAGLFITPAGFFSAAACLFIATGLSQASKRHRTCSQQTPIPKLWRKFLGLNISPLDIFTAPMSVTLQTIDSETYGRGAIRVNIGNGEARGGLDCW